MTEQECRALFFREAYVLASSEPEMYRGFKLGLKIGSASELRRLHEVNAELVEALSWLVAAVDADGYSTKYQRGLSKASYALAKAQGENND